MKNLLRIACVICVTALIVGCLPPKPATIVERISRFEDGLNSAGSNLQEHFHPDQTLNYAQIADDVVFDSGPLSYANMPFSITNPDVDVADIATCDFLNGFSVTGEIVFEMALYGDDYRIKKFTLTIAGTPYVVENF